MTLAVNIAQSGSSNVTFRNKIINGAMVFDQRNAGASVTPASGTYTLDRWFANIAQSSKFSVQQTPSATETGFAVRVAAGFTNYLATTSTSAYSVLTADYFSMYQIIEGNNISDLAWGTASAKTVTLSFYVRSSLTGTFGGALNNSGFTRSYPFSYSISVANTWEQKTITVAGDTSGTWLTTNGIGMVVSLSLGAGSTYSGTANAWAGSTLTQPTGSTSVVGTNGATFYITGVQLEAGTTASPFEYRQYGTELALCQRYYQRQFPVRGGGAGTGSTGVSRVKAPLIVTMRASPTATISGTLNTYDGLAGGSITSFGSVWMTPDLLEFDATFASGSTVTGKYNSVYNDASANTGALSTAGVILSAEL